MRILFVHNRYLQSAGGEDMAVEAEMNLLKGRGHIAEALYFSNKNFGGSFTKKLQSGIGAIYNKQSKHALLEKINDFNPDIIHVHNFFFEASPSVFDAAAEAGVPVVFTIHNYRLLCVNSLLLRNGRICEDCIHSLFPLKGVLCRCYHGSFRDSTMVGLISATQKIRNKLANKVNRIITPSLFMRQKFLNSSLHIRDTEKIIVKPNFIEDPGAGIADKRGDFFLFVGRLSFEKGADKLLECFAGLPDEILVMVGDGPEEEKWKTRYSGSKNIQFAGRKSKPEVIQLMKSCRALIFPSICYEGLPLTIIEAFATGTPVIGSRLGAMQEMIVPEFNGLLFERGNIAELRQAIEIMGKHVERADHSMNEGARKTYIEKYHPDICYQQVIEVYEKAIAENKEKRKGKNPGF